MESQKKQCMVPNHQPTSCSPSDQIFASASRKTMEGINNLEIPPGNQAWPGKSNIWLVGGWPTPLKNMKVSWDDYSQYMEKKMFQTTSQLMIFLAINLQLVRFSTFDDTRGYPSQLRHLWPGAMYHTYWKFTFLTAKIPVQPSPPWMIPEISRKGWQKQNLTRQMALKTRLWFLLNINPTTIQHSYGKWSICKWCILIRTYSFLQLCEIVRGTACKHPETNRSNLLVSGLPAMGMENQPRKKTMERLNAFMV